MIDSKPELVFKKICTTNKKEEKQEIENPEEEKFTLANFEAKKIKITNLKSELAELQIEHDKKIESLNQEILALQFRMDSAYEEFSLMSKEREREMAVLEMKKDMDLPNADAHGELFDMLTPKPLITDEILEKFMRMK